MTRPVPPPSPAAAMSDTRPSPDPDPAATVAYPSVAAGPAFREGQVVAGYALLHKVGEGGMGVVFAARDEQTGRRVAVKVMHPWAAADPVARGRFLREARVLAALEHDHVVRLYVVGEHDGQPFLVMEYLPGGSLRERLKEHGRLILPDAVRVGRDAARGLAAAHALGLVHRDLSPGNIWVEPSGRAKLLDFGLAAAPGEPQAEPLTRSGAVMGTPGYMSPEQAAGEPADHRSDLFGLGCVLYLLATGAKPFAGTGKSPGSEIAAVLTADPAPPRECNPEIPESLDRLIRDLLAKAPADRPASAAEAADRLTAILEEVGDEPPPGMRMVPVGIPMRDWKRNRARAKVSVRLGCLTLTLSATLAVLVIVGGLSEYTRPSIDAPMAQVQPETKIPLPPQPVPPEPTSGSAFPPLDPNGAATLAALPRERQADELTAQFRRRNPDFRGTVQMQWDESGRPHGIKIESDAVVDLTPARALPGLTGLICNGSGPRAGRLTDLTPLTGLPIVSLEVRNQRVRDLKPVRAFKPGSAAIYYLCVAGTAVESLEPLRGLTVQQIDLRDTPVRDLRPLAEAGVLSVDIDWPNGPDPAPLRNCPMLGTINGGPAAAFWAKVGKK